MYEALNLFAGIGFRPTIAGWLTVLVATAVLMGSIWLLLSTNSGIRVGTLVSLAGFFGWMTIMGFIWWIYGIGYLGESPSWQTIDVNVGDLDQSVLAEARDLPDRDEWVDEFGTPFDIVAASGNEVAQLEFDPELTADQTVGLSDDAIAYRSEQRRIRVENKNLSEVVSVAPEVIDNLGIEFGGWTLQSAADGGEAQATAAGDIEANDVFPDTDENGNPVSYIFLETYDLGGKPRLPENPNRWDRISTWFGNAARITHPPHWTVVQVQRTLYQETPPGQPPPALAADPNAPVVSLIMVRDLGNRRFPPFMIMLGSLLLFLMLCYLLHVRDIDQREREKAFELELEKAS